MGEIEGPVLVLGLGVSGVAAARALGRAGVVVRAVDTGAAAAAHDNAASLRAVDIDAVAGEPADPALLDGFATVVVSPGIADTDPVVTAALRRGMPVWSEPELAWRLRRGDSRLVGVTGTNGKTTTTELLAACLDAPAAGNIGTPLVALLSGEAPVPPLVVVELSSFQLRFTEALHCEVAVLLNLAQDHLDWHGGMDRYGAAKARLWSAQGPGDTLVVNVEDPGALALVAAHPTNGALVGATTRPPARGQVGVEHGMVVARLDGDVAVAAVDDLALRGPHNVGNVCAGVAAALVAGAQPERIGDRLRGLRAGSHRLEVVANAGGVEWVNDSKATNPHAAAAALTSFDSVVWIAGGLAKGVSFETLEPVLRERVRAVLAIGAAAPQLLELARDVGVAAVEAGDLATAVRAAAGLARAGDTVLLAPACASMDQFRDYAHRGTVFRELVEDLVRAGGGGTAAQPGEENEWRP